MPTPKSIELIYNSLQPLISSYSIGLKDGILPLPNAMPETITDYLNHALSPNIAKGFRRIYASCSREVLSYVKDRGKITLIDPDNIELKIELDQLKLENETLKSFGQSLQKERDIIEQDYKNKLGLVNTELKKKEDLLVQVQGVGSLDNSVMELDRKMQMMLSAMNELTQKLDFAVKNFNHVISVGSWQNRHHESSNGDSKKGQPGNHKGRSKKKAGSRQAINEFLKDPVAVIKRFKIPFLIAAIGFGFLFTILIILFDANPVQDEIKVYHVATTQLTTDEKPDPIDRDKLIHEANEFYQNAVAANNIYEPNDLHVLIKSLSDLNLHDDSIYTKLVDLLNNFGLTHYPFERLKKEEYRIREGDKALESIEDNIYKEDKRAKKMKGFMPTLKAFNQIDKGYKFKTGNTLIYYIPQETD